MQKFLNVLRWTVGILFILSGLIKANDPLGLSYKIDEFLNVWRISLISDSITMYFAVFMNILEIVAGLALIIKFPYKQTLWLLLGLIIFFSFLTGYALFSGKIKTCGCFGDCIPLSPKTSFIKDILLFISIVILLMTKKKVKSKIKQSIGITLLLFTSIGIGYGQYYVLNHLPIIDCLPYKVGNDIVEKMKLPAGAVPDSIDIKMEFLKDGKTYFFSPASLPNDFDESYVFKGRKDFIIKGNGIKAEIVDFYLRAKSGVDSTKTVFANKVPYVLIFADQIDGSKPWNEILKKAKLKYSKVYIVITREVENAAKSFPSENILTCDNTILRTVARVWPTVYVMNGSVIMQKQSYLDFLNN